jgi:hypothetical protein
LLDPELKSDSHRYRCISKRQLDLSGAFTKCDMAKHILYILGYEDILDHEILFISDLQGSLPLLSAFCRLVEEELTIKIDPAALQTLQASSMTSKSSNMTSKSRQTYKRITRMVFE